MLRTSTYALRYPVPSLDSLPWVLSLRGTCLLVFLLILVFGPISNQNDIVAAVLAYSLLALLLILVVVTSIKGIKLKRNLHLELYPPEDSALFSGVPCQFAVRTSIFSLPPFIVLNLQVIFQSKEILSSIHKLSGSNSEQRVILDDLTFPHRGKWLVKHLALKLEDRFGLTCYKWKFDLPQALTIKPPIIHDVKLPIFNSCQRSGDMLLDINERHGDPFDLKQYHPSDGLRKILWKIFAKSGELISRHPERSMTPEGQVLIFCLASKEDDALCAQTLCYLRYLEELDLQIYFGCEGMRNTVPVNTSTESEKLLIESVWNTINSNSESTLIETTSLLDALQKASPETKIDKVLLFVSQSRLHSKQSFEIMQSTCNLLTSQQITPAIFMLRDLEYSESQQRDNAVWALLKPWLLHKEDARAELGNQYYNSFLHLCASHNWDLIMV